MNKEKREEKAGEIKRGRLIELNLFLMLLIGILLLPLIFAIPQEAIWGFYEK